MAKSSNQKTKLLHLYQILLRQTDEDHPITVAQIIQELGKYGIKAERKSIYDDLESLRQFGLDVQCRKGKTAGWFVGERDFQLPELKLLMDAVQSSRFITQKKSDALIRKLEGLASVHQARQLQRQVYVSGRIKLMNESIYYNVDKLHTAVSGQRAITFKYFDYDLERKKVFRREGRRYTVSPYGLIWNNENYYLVAFDSKAADFRHFRVDNMTDISVTDLLRDGREYYDKIDMAHYRSAHFGMFSGEEVSVALLCRNELIGVIIDRFGTDIPIIPKDSGYFTTHINVVVSQQFIGWLVGIGEGITVLSPDSVLQRLQAEAERLKRLYPQDIPM